MSDEITFTGDRWGQTAMLGFAVLIGALGTWFMMHGAPWIGGGSLLMAVLLAVIALPVIISPELTYLRLDSQGFEVGSRRTKHRVQWEEVAAFRSSTFDDYPVIEIEYANSGKGPVLLRILDNYNASLSDILSELVDWRTRFGPQR